VAYTLKGQMVNGQQDQDHQAHRILLILLAMCLRILKNQVLKVFMKFRILIDSKEMQTIKFQSQGYQQLERKIKEVRKI